LVGLYEKSSGEAKLAGYDLETQSEYVYRKIGVCPQFDILWEDLTVEEHLYFYARLKGISAADEASAVNESLKRVSLVDLRRNLSKALSGGEKRRLSIAIALVGNPSVVFLDEPTTGLDPEVRRLIWNIISEAKSGKSIILTTHSMEEAEALCGRIGIMAKGTLRCLANPTRLKQLYGSGFKLFFNSLESSTEEASKFIESLLPEGWTKIDAFATNVSYEFPAVDGTIGSLFEQIEQEKSKHGILDWGLGQTTLEEVFIRLIGDEDAQADY
jgi:ABC-type multidrug transport system ATPase subunit